MKRTFKSLLAAAALAFVGLGSLFASSPAMAYTPVGPCVKYPATSTSNWPGNGAFFNCTGNPADVVMLQVYNKAVQNANAFPTLATKMFLGNVKIFVFPNVSDYNSYAHFSGNPVPPPPNGGTVRGYTRSSQGGGLSGPVIAVFTVPSGFTYGQRVLNHEMGHALDMVTGNESVTSGSTWRNLLFQDLADLDALPPRNFAGFTPACNAYPKNSDRLNCMHNNLPTFDAAETFAEEFATFMASSGVFLEADSVFTNYFRAGGALNNPARNPRSVDRVRSKF